MFQENKARQIFRKTNISYPLIRTCTCAYQGVRNVRFSGNLTCFVFLKHPFGDSPFCPITNDIAFCEKMFQGLHSSNKHINFKDSFWIFLHETKLVVYKNEIRKPWLLSGFFGYLMSQHIPQWAR